MEPSAIIADPERALTLAYARAQSRAALAALWRLDERLGSVVAATREPMVGAIRLAWWREALEALDNGPPPAEPLLGEIATALLPIGIRGTELAEIEAGWSALLAADPLDEEAIVAHGRLRGRPLFALAARLLAGTPFAKAAPAGEAWALADLGARLDDPRLASLAKAKAMERLAELEGLCWPVTLRPLGALVLLARRDARLGHGRRQGSPARVARVLLHRLTGR
jgi:phytoene synthase